ncbi:hypothetical protein [Streptomyces sp. NPDC055287]
MNRTKIAAVALAATATLGSIGSSPASASANEGAQVQADPAYKILKHLEYRGPGRVSLRLGYYNAAADKGFGWTKVKKKHNITKYSAVEYIAKSPVREHIGGQSYRHTGYAGKYKCRNGVCQLVKQYKVLMSANEKKLRDDHDKGVITEYCEGIVRCPNWVTKALAKSNRSSVAAEGDNKYVGAYKPFARTVQSADVKAGVNKNAATR